MSGADPAIFKKKRGGQTIGTLSNALIVLTIEGVQPRNLPVDPALHVFDLTVPYEQAC